MKFFINQFTAHTVKTIGYTVFTISIFTLISCQNTQREVPATTTSATPSLFPDEQADNNNNDQRSVPPLVGYSPDPVSTISNQGSQPKPAPKKSTPKPFALRSGEKLVNHKAVSGDNLWKMAREYDTSVSRIKSANGLTTDTIFKGKVYKVPTVNGRVVSSPSPAPAGSAPKPTPSRTSAPPAPAPISTTTRIPPTPSRSTTDIPRTAPSASSSPGGSAPKTFPIPTGTSSGASSFPRPTFGTGNY